jgi:hypothetical protein
VRAEALFQDLNLSEKLRSGSAFEVFKGKRSEVPLQKEGHGEGTLVHFIEVLEEGTERSEFYEENSRNSEEHRIQGSCKGS